MSGLIKLAILAGLVGIMDREHQIAAEVGHWTVAKNRPLDVVKLQRQSHDHPAASRRSLTAFESFFTREGRAMPDGRRLSGLAKRSLAARAYWRGMRALSRSDPAGALPLFGYAFRMHPTTLILPPVGYLFATRRRFG